MALEEEYNLGFPGLKEAEEQPTNPPVDVVGGHGVRREVLAALHKYVGDASEGVRHSVLMSYAFEMGATPEETAEVLKGLQLKTPLSYVLKEEA